MPEAVQQSLAIDTPPAAAPAKPAAPAQRGRYELPAESEPAKPAPQASPDPAQKSTVEAPEAQPTESEKPDLTPEEAEKRREQRRFDRKVDKLHRQAAEARARAELAEKTLKERTDATAKPADPGEPKLEQFDYDPEKYAQAKADYAKKQGEKEWEAKQRAAESNKQRERLLTAWEEKADKAADKYDDFSTVVGELQPVNPLTTAIMEVDAGVAYHLAKHPKEAERIAALSPISQILEIGRLEAKLAAEPEKPKAPSKAPAPIKPLSGASSPASDVPSEQDSTEAWIRKRNKIVNRRRLGL